MPSTLETLHSLRSIHGNFSDREVTSQDLDAILACAVRAANASNRQSYSIIVIDEPQEILACCGYTGSKALLFCVDFNRLTALAEHTGHTYVPDGPVAFVTGAVDAALAAQTAAVAAKGLGIDSLFTNGIHRKESRSIPVGGLEEVARQFNLPEKYCFPLILLILGYPAEDPSPSTGGASQASSEPAALRGRVTCGVIHHGSYQPCTSAELEEQVSAYDDPQTRLSAGRGWANAGFAHYLDWYFEKWALRGDPAAKEKEFTEFLTQAGFLR
jgi:nitroreductase